MFSDAWTAQTQDPNHFFGLGIIVSKAFKFIYVTATQITRTGDMTYLGTFFQAKFKIV